MNVLCSLKLPNYVFPYLVLFLFMMSELATAHQVPSISHDLFIQFGKVLLNSFTKALFTLSLFISAVGV